MDSFLGQLAAYILEQHPHDREQVAVVLPSRRAGLFFRKHLSQRIGKTFFPPQIITISELVETLSGQRLANATELGFILYEAYRETEGETAEPFDRFSKWGQILLSDFNEIDRYLLDAEKVFADLRNIREIEHWSFLREDLSPNQQQYLLFWNRLYKYYLAFQQKLETAGITYQGKLYRTLATQAETLGPQLPYTKVYFAGFNALSASEEKLIDTWMKQGKADIFFDADAWYTDNEAHEAGLFFRRIRQKWGEAKFRWKNEFFSTRKGRIEITGAPGQVAQARVAGQLLEQLSAKAPLHDIALVLADESLLLPVLHSLPDAVSRVNITMGYPLRLSDYFALFQALFSLHEHNRLREDGAYRIYFRDFLDVLQQPVVRGFLGDEALEIEQELIRTNRVYLRSADLKRIGGPRFAQLRFVVEPWENIPSDPLATFEKLNLLFRDWYQHTAPDKLALEYVFLFSRITESLREMCTRYPYVQELPVFKQLFRQYVAREDIAFFGEPLEGLQLMGMLETRALDFRKVIVLSVNEEILPRPKFENSFIPFDIKSRYNLPAYREKEAVFANHFYRLIQRAEEVYLVYNTDQDTFGGGEKSRFILQLEQELPALNPQIELVNRTVQLPATTAAMQAQAMPRDSFSQARLLSLLSGGVSPSALSTFIRCPLDFYYRYLAGIRQAEALEESADEALLGEVVHTVLDEFYRPFCGKVLRAADVKAMQTRVETATSAAFRKHFGEATIAEGRNHLVYRVAVLYLDRYLSAEAGFLENSLEALTILHTEYTLEAPLTLNLPSGEVQIRLKGNADRIDKLGDTYRIIDYKTGRTEPRKLVVSDWNKLVVSPEMAKSLQLLCYAYMYRYANPSHSPLLSGIASLRSYSLGLMPVKTGDTAWISEETWPLFTEAITALVTAMYDASIPFAHNSESRFCELCV